MPHVARKRSASGYYHVVPKGIADQLIFESDADRAYYVTLLGKTKVETGIKVHAYCLMSNHTHLVIEDEHDRLPEAMKYVHERYAMYYAHKIGRSGGVFRKPYWSEPIETDAHLLCAVRYVHANPAAAGLCHASAYDWSSAKDYLGRQNGITDTDMVLEMTGGRTGFVTFSQMANATLHPFPGSKLRLHDTDDERARIAREVLGRDDLNLVKEDIMVRSQSVELLASRGFSISSIVRLTGIGRSFIERTLGKR